MAHFNNYYSPFSTNAEEQPVCKDCGSPALAQLDYDVTCTVCGLEQGFGNFDVQTYFFENNPTPLTSTKRDTVPHDIFQFFAAAVPVHDCIIDGAKDMYSKYSQHRSPSDEDDQYPLVMACIYYYSRKFARISRERLIDTTIKYTSHTHVNDVRLTKAMGLIKERLVHLREYNDVFFQIGAPDVTKTISHMVNVITNHFRLNDEQKRVLVKGAETISSVFTMRICGIDPETTAASSIFLASESKNYSVVGSKLTLKDVSCVTKVKLGTLSKAVNQVKDMLKHKKMAKA